MLLAKVTSTQILAFFEEIEQIGKQVVAFFAFETAGMPNVLKI
jgi:hypothetical protein